MLFLAGLSMKWNYKKYIHFTFMCILLLWLWFSRRSNFVCNMIYEWNEICAEADPQQSNQLYYIHFFFVMFTFNLNCILKWIKKEFVVSHCSMDRGHTDIQFRLQANKQLLYGRSFNFYAASFFFILQTNNIRTKANGTIKSVPATVRALFFSLSLSALKGENARA